MSPRETPVVDAGDERLPAPELPGWLAAMLPPDARRYLLPLGGQLVHVMETGPVTGRPVLLVHGNPTWGFLWRKVATALAGSGLRVVMPDLVGLGLSSKPRVASAHTLRAHTDWMAAVVRTLDLRDVVLGVQDWGGPIGVGALVGQTERLSALVVGNTVLGPPKEGFRATAFHRFARLPVLSELVFRGLGFPQATLGRAQGDPASIRGDVARAYRWPLRGLSRNVAPLALARMVPDSMTHPSVGPLTAVEALIAGFSGPAAIVWGDRDPVLGRLKARIARALPQAEVVSTQAGHFLQEEVPEELAAAVRRVAG